MMERRTEPRMLCADLVDVRWKEAGGKSQRVVANLEDISLSGACLQVDDPIPVKAEVGISYSKGNFAGVVRYCHYRDIGYFIGVEFEPGMKWSEHAFKPLHLLDPRALTKKAPTSPKNRPNA